MARAQSAPTPTSPAPEQRSLARLARAASLQAWRVRVRGEAGRGGHQADCAVRAASPDGMLLEGGSAAILGRYVWLDVDLPDGGALKALGEVVGASDPVGLALDIKFKHLFPRHRATLEAALAR